MSIASYLHPTRATVACFLLASIGLTMDASSATRTRNGTVGNLNVNTNWVGNTLPNINDYALWTNASALTGDLGANTNWLGIQVTTITGALTIGGTQTLTLGIGGINMDAAADNVTINPAITTRAITGQVWNVASGRTLSLTGTFTRGANSIVNVRGAGTVNVAGTGLANNATGIIGNWFTFGTGASTRYATVNASNQIVAASGTTAADLNSLTSSSVNYLTAATGTFGADSQSNTLVFTGAADTVLDGNHTTNGIINAGAGKLTLSGQITVGASKDLIITVPDSPRNIEISGEIRDYNGNEASNVTFAHTTSNNGAFTLSGASTYTGTTYILSGVVNLSHANGLGSTLGGTTINTANRASLRLSNNITVGEELTFTGGDPNSTSNSSLYNSSGTNTVTGNIRLEDSLRIGGTGSTSVLNIQGGITSVGGADRQLVLNPGSSTINFSVAPILIGNGTLYFDQDGLVTLGVGGNSWGRTIVAGGTLRMLGENYLPTAAVLQIGVAYGNSNGKLDLNGFSQSTGRLEQSHASPGQILSATAATLSVNQGSANSMYNGTISGAVALSKQGTGTLTLGGNNTHTGETNVTVGAIQLIQAAASSGVAATSTLNNSTITLSSVAGLAVGQSVTGTNIPSGAYITSINTVNNTITVSRNATATGATTLAFGAMNGTLRNSTVNLTGTGSVTYGAQLTDTVFGGLKGNQNHSLNNASDNAVALTVGGNDESTVYSGILSGAGSITKVGTGALTLQGASTYTGATVIEAGTLLASNTTGSATGTGSVSTTAASGATLGGTGSITGGTAQSISLNTGTFLMVGNTHNTAGTAQRLQLGNAASVNHVDINLQGTLLFDLFSSQAGTPTTEADLLALYSTQAVDLAGGQVSLAIAPGVDTSAWTVGDTWKLIDWTSTPTTGSLTLASSLPSVNGHLWTSYTDATGFYVQLAAVPEPSRALLLLSGLGFILGTRRRRARTH